MPVSKRTPNRSAAASKSRKSAAGYHKAGPGPGSAKWPAASKKAAKADLSEFDKPLFQRPKAAAEPPPARERGSYDGDTAFKLYLREIGQVALLTPQEEIELAARIKKGDKKARELMIKANLRLVVKIAHDYEGFGLPLLDLIS